MSQVTYRPRVSPYQPKPKHPYQVLREKAHDFQDSTHPVRQEIQRCLGKHVLTANVEEDMQTLSAMKGTEGLIAFICTLTKDGRMIAQGRGSAVLGPATKFISRTVGCAFNSAISDAAIRATKVLDTLRSKTEVEIEEVMKDMESSPASDKQRQYLRQLIQVNVAEQEERDYWDSRIDELTKKEASDAIMTFKS